MNEFLSLFQILKIHPFLIMALLAGCLASFASGIVGSYVVAKRIVFISGSISHSVLGGMGICLWLQRTYEITWLTPFDGALIAALLSAFMIGRIHLYYKEREDTIIATLWAFGMAIGVIFISITPGYNVELMNFLFGSILWTGPTDVIKLFLLDLLVILLVLPFHRKFLALCFDEEQAFLQGLRVHSLYFLLLALVAISVVVLIEIVGSILVIAMLAIPPAIASTFTYRLSRIMLIAIALGIFFTYLGVNVSYHLNWPPGATIAFTSSLFYLLNLVFKGFQKKITKTA